MDEPCLGLQMPSACGGIHGPHWGLLYVSVEETGCARGPGGLEEPWAWDENVPACDSLTTRGKWQVQNSHQQWEPS